MEKLIKKFEKINGRMLSQHGNAISSAEEAKKLIIDFFIWYETSNIQNTTLNKGLPQMGRSFNIKELGEELFELFITEFYGKIEGQV